MRDIIATWLIYGVVLLGLVLLSETRSPLVGDESSMITTPKVVESLVEQEFIEDSSIGPRTPALTQSAKVGNRGAAAAQ